MTQTLHLVAHVGACGVLIHAGRVDSVVDVDAIVPAPGAAPGVLGLAAMRSRVATVVDPRHVLGLPRGTGALGFYEKEEERVPILSVRLGSEAADVPSFEYLSIDSGSFAAYADARANRRDPFFNVPAGGADICNIPVPIRRKAK